MPHATTGAKRHSKRWPRVRFETVFITTIALGLRRGLSSESRIPPRLLVQQPAHEIVPPAAHYVVAGVAVGVARVRYHQQIEILVRLDERVHHQLRIPRRHVWRKLYARFSLHRGDPCRPSV